MRNPILGITNSGGAPKLEIQYLVIAGGGGGGGNEGNSQAVGSGGAGGYRSSVSGEASGGGASAESVFVPTPSTNYTVTIGAGGAGGFSATGLGSNARTSVSIPKRSKAHWVKSPMLAPTSMILSILSPTNILS